MISGLKNTKQMNIALPRNVRGELEKFYSKPIAKVSLELLLSLGTVMFFAVFALRPTLTTMAQLTREIEDKQEVDEALSLKLASLATAQSEFYAYEDRFVILNDAVHDQPTLETALFYLEYLVRRENISLAALRIETFPVGGLQSVSGSTGTGTSADTATQEIGIYAIQTSFEGDYANIVAFFEVLESIRPLFAVESFTLTSGTNPDNPNVLRANATIYMYGYRPRATPAPAARSSINTVTPEDDNG